MVLVPAFGATTAVPPRLLWCDLEGHCVATACASSGRLLTAIATSPDKGFQLLGNSQQLSQIIPQAGQFRELWKDKKTS